MVSATILDLALKKVIELNVKNENIVVKILNQNPQDLKSDENEIFELLKDVGKNKEEFEIKELNQYAKKKYYKYSANINNCVNYARNNLYKINLIDKREEKEYAGCEMASLTTECCVKILFLLNSKKYKILTIIFYNFFCFFKSIYFA